MNLLVVKRVAHPKKRGKWNKKNINRNREVDLLDSINSRHPLVRALLNIIIYKNINFCKLANKKNGRTSPMKSRMSHAGQQKNNYLKSLRKHSSIIFLG